MRSVQALIKRKIPMINILSVDLFMAQIIAGSSTSSFSSMWDYLRHLRTNPNQRL